MPTDFTIQGHKFTLPPLKAHLFFWPVLIIGTLLDLWTKSYIFSWLQEKENFSFAVIDGFFNFVIAENTGAAFGIAAGRTIFLITISVIALLVILCAFFLSSIKNKFMPLALALLSAGICGNLWDRIFNDGRVRDFIDIVYWPGRHWPAFNIADSMLCIGIGIIILLNLTEKRTTS